jgi:L-ascorbate metabolism protein UlaG (beta-lactamase superfamily)
MKITKFVHSCLLVEMPEPVNRTVLFDPGAMSVEALDIGKLEFLDDIIITHSHGDHLSMDLVKQLVAKFPKVRITTTSENVETLAKEGISATDQPSEGIVLFESLHEDVHPIFPQPQNIGVHYLDLLTDPGDSHHFSESKQILAMPVTAPWGSTIKALNLILELKPKHVLPIHDWHWSDAARASTYDILEQHCSNAGITFHKLKTGEPVVIETK